jgi:hypothetical protein
MATTLTQAAHGLRVIEDNKNPLLRLGLAV